MIGKLLRRLTGGDGELDSRALQVEVERLRAQNESMKKAMRHCVTCEYRLEVVSNRQAEGRTADGGPGNGEPAPR